MMNRATIIAGIDRLEARSAPLFTIIFTAAALLADSLTSFLFYGGLSAYWWRRAWQIKRDRDGDGPPPGTYQAG